MVVLLLVVLYKVTFFVIIRISPNAFSRFDRLVSLCSDVNSVSDSQSSGKRDSPSTDKSLASVQMNSIVDIDEKLVDAFQKLKRISDDLDIVTDKENDIQRESEQEKQHRLAEIRSEEEHICIIEYLIWFSMYNEADDDYLHRVRHLSQEREPLRIPKMDEYENVVSRFFQMLARLFTSWISFDSPTSGSKLTRLSSQTRDVLNKQNNGFSESSDLYQVQAIKRKAFSAKINNYKMEIYWDGLIFFLVGCLICLVEIGKSDQIHTSNKSIRIENSVESDQKTFSEKKILTEQSESSRNSVESVKVSADKDCESREEEEETSESTKVSPDSENTYGSLRYYLFMYFSHMYFILMVIIGMWDNISPNTSNFISIWYVCCGLSFLVYNGLNTTPHKFNILSKPPLFCIHVVIILFTPV
jgi:hypothetical protein